MNRSGGCSLTPSADHLGVDVLQPRQGESHKLFQKIPRKPL